MGYEATYSKIKIKIEPIIYKKWKKIKLRYKLFSGKKYYDWNQVEDTILQLYGIDTYFSWDSPCIDKQQDYPKIFSDVALQYLKIKSNQQKYWHFLGWYTHMCPRRKILPFKKILKDIINERTVYTFGHDYKAHPNYGLYRITEILISVFGKSGRFYFEKWSTGEKIYEENIVFMKPKNKGVKN